MAVSIDTVYQRVLAIANKEQRGYLTPQEFNLLANQAQMDIFEQYFYDLNQFSRIKRNETEYSDMVDIINEKLEYLIDHIIPTLKNCFSKQFCYMYIIGYLLQDGDKDIVGRFPLKLYDELKVEVEE